MILEDIVELDEAIRLLKKAVKHTGTINQKHIDLSIVPAVELPKYENALKVSQMAIKDGKISKEEFMRRMDLT